MTNKKKRVCSKEFKEQMIRACKECKPEEKVENKNVKNKDVGKTNLIEKDELARLKKESQQMAERIKLLRRKGRRF